MKSLMKHDHERAHMYDLVDNAHVDVNMKPNPEHMIRIEVDTADTGPVQAVPLIGQALSIQKQHTDGSHQLQGKDSPRTRIYDGAQMMSIT
jgi:hypothetical protein